MDGVGGGRLKAWIGGGVKMELGVEASGADWLWWREDFYEILFLPGRREKKILYFDIIYMYIYDNIQ